MPKVELVVIGASAGGLDGLLTIVKDLPDYLPEILGRVSRLPVKLVTDHQAVGRGQVLVAPPDFHVAVTRGILSLTHGPRENGFRPAIDPLFRSAARSRKAPRPLRVKRATVAARRVS